MADIDDLAIKLDDLSDEELDKRLAEIRANRRQKSEAPRKTKVALPGAAPTAKAKAASAVEKISQGELDEFADI